MIVILGYPNNFPKTVGIIGVPKPVIHRNPYPPALRNSVTSPYFEKWRHLWEKIERQAKGDQNVCNEPNDAPLNSWVPIIPN